MSAHRLRLYSREAGRPLELLRDGQLAQQSLQSAQPGVEDGEVVVQLLSTEERLPHDHLLLGYLLLNVVGAADSTGAVHAQASPAVPLRHVTRSRLACAGEVTRHTKSRSPRLTRAGELGLPRAPRRPGGRNRRAHLAARRRPCSACPPQSHAAPAAYARLG